MLAFSDVTGPSAAPEPGDPEPGDPEPGDDARSVRDEDHPTEPEPSGSPPSGSEGGWGSVVLGLLTAFSGALAVLVVLGKVVVDPIQYGWVRLNWPAVDGTVLRSVILDKAPSGSLPRKMRGLAARNWPEVTVQYTAGGALQHTTAIAGYSTAWRWRPTPEQVLAAAPVGSVVRVRFDPDAPGEGLIDLGLQGWQVYETIPGVAVLSLLGLGVATIVLRRRLHRQGFAAVVHEDSRGRLVIRLPRGTGTGWAVICVLLATGLVMIGSPLLFGRQVSLSAAAAMALLVPAAGLLGAIAERLWSSRQPTMMLDLAGRLMVLPDHLLPEPWRAHEGIPFKALRRIAAVTASGGRTSLAIDAACPGGADHVGCEFPIPKSWSTSADNLAQWISGEVGVSSAAAPRR